jgi:hypothetical protein
MGPQTLPSFLYVDEAAADAQFIALERLYQAFMPARPMVFSTLKRTPISLAYSPKTHRYDVRIPGILDMTVRRRLTPSGQPLLPSAAVDYLANVIEYAQNLAYRFHNPETGSKFDYTGRQSNYRTFDISSDDYSFGRMLIQYADGSGSFNEKQRELIRAQQLPVLARPVRRTNR